MKHNTRKRLGAAALCALLSLPLGGCTQQSAAPVATLPPAAMRLPCPSGDLALAYTSSASLYLPSLNGQRLLAQQATLELNHAASSAKSAVRTLLEYPANDVVRALSGTVNLTLYGRTPIEVSGGICTVNLASSAKNLEREDFYTLCLSIASTLGQLGNLNSVNVLVADQAVGLDLAGRLPTGTVSAHPGEDLTVLWKEMVNRGTPLGGNAQQTPLTSAATLYFPLSDGSGFVPEAQNITFEGQTPTQLADGLLGALSAGAQYLEGICAMPDLYGMLISPPAASEMADGSRMITLSFEGDFEERLTRAGVDPACMTGAITYTLTTFIPGVSVVQIMCGQTPMTSVYSQSLGTLRFADGMQRRSQYTGMLMEQVSVCMARGDHLVQVQRSIPCGDASDLRALMKLLCGGPTAAEERAGYQPVMPEGIDETDLLGLSIVEDTLVINLSERFGQAIAQQSVNEQLMCYAMVNTLCEAKGLRRACFYVTGDVMGTIGGDIYWGGEFMVNRSLIEP